MVATHGPAFARVNGAVYGAGLVRGGGAKTGMEGMSWWDFWPSFTGWFAESPASPDGLRRLPRAALLRVHRAVNVREPGVNWVSPVAPVPSLAGRLTPNAEVRLERRASLRSAERTLRTGPFPPAR